MALTANLTRGNPLAVDMAAETAMGGGAEDAVQNIFMTGGRLFHIIADNDDSSRAYWKAYNRKDVVVGTSEPTLVIPLNGSGQNGGKTHMVIATGLKMNVAFSMACNASNDFTSVADPVDTALDVSVLFARTADISGS